jgi:hypothetical protein
MWGLRASDARPPPSGAAGTRPCTAPHSLSPLPERGGDLETDGDVKARVRRSRLRGAGHEACMGEGRGERGKGEGGPRGEGGAGGPGGDVQKEKEEGPRPRGAPSAPRPARVLQGGLSDTCTCPFCKFGCTSAGEGTLHGSTCSRHACTLPLLASRRNG